MFNLPDGAFEFADSAYCGFQLFRIPMNGVPTHTFCSRQQLQVIQGYMGLVAVLEAHAHVYRDWSVMLLPKQYMHGFPVNGWVTGIGDFLLLITVRSCAQAANRQPVPWFIAGLKLRLSHTARGGEPLKALIPWDGSLGKAEFCAQLAVKPATETTAKKLGAFAQAQPFGFGIDLIDAEPQFGG
ncbi:hypothetical protein TX24_17765 [Pseudomonas lactis]|nr:hypothetical protein TX24_17765 [Pseudomonas lactis]